MYAKQEIIANEFIWCYNNYGRNVPPPRHFLLEGGLISKKYGSLFLKSTVIAVGARTVNALKVKCSRNSNSCDWTGELGSLETHQKSCGYALLPCTNQCKIDSIVSTFSRKALDRHLATDCPKRQRKCPHCKEMGEHQERTTTHLETCPSIRVNCPNTDCRSRVLRCNIATHLATCRYESVACKYAAVGCEERPSRRELKEHEEDALFHLRVTTENNLELTQKVELLATDVLKSKKLLTTVDSHLTFKLTNYREHKNKRFLSPSFYTSHSGYKMCLLVYANGKGYAAYTNVSVYAHLMKGDHDDTLTWPFTGRVTVELLNQLKDKNHHRKTFTFSADNEASERVVDRERGGGFGCPTFIFHASLDCNASGNTQYLKDDTLVFRVSVETLDHKPWLECTV